MASWACQVGVLCMTVQLRLGACRVLAGLAVVMSGERFWLLLRVGTTVLPSALHCCTLSPCPDPRSSGALSPRVLPHPRGAWLGRRLTHRSLSLPNGVSSRVGLPPRFLPHLLPWD